MKIVKHTLVLIFVLSFIYPGVCERTIPLNPDDIYISREEAKLYDLINTYRKSKGLEDIPLSLNLTIVAQSHAIDLFENKPHNISELCNLHSWSDKGDWEACCYTSDHANAECMWHKPREITNYTGIGYEIVFFYSPVTDKISLAEEALEAWQDSPGHNNTIINAEIWINAEWKAIGVGIYKEYVTVWFGEDKDEEKAPPFK